MSDILLYLIIGYSAACLGATVAILLMRPKRETPKPPQKLGDVTQRAQKAKVYTFTK